MVLEIGGGKKNYHKAMLTGLVLALGMAISPSVRHTEIALKVIVTIRLDRVPLHFMG